ncbi:hypothetical protein K8R47_00030 [archaeon]|nr:hypothetical protein [archaeon]
MTEKKLIRRCLGCQSISLDGRILSKTEYNPDTLKERGFNFSDTYLSEKCFSDYIDSQRQGYIDLLGPEEGEREFQILKISLNQKKPKADLDKCPI